MFQSGYSVQCVSLLSWPAGREPTVSLEVLTRDLMRVGLRDFARVKTAVQNLLKWNLVKDRQKTITPASQLSCAYWVEDVLPLVADRLK